MGFSICTIVHGQALINGTITKQDEQFQGRGQQTYTMVISDGNQAQCFLFDGSSKLSNSKICLSHVLEGSENTMGIAQNSFHVIKQLGNGIEQIKEQFQDGVIKVHGHTFSQFKTLSKGEACMNGKKLNKGQMYLVPGHYPYFIETKNDAVIEEFCVGYKKVKMTNDVHTSTNLALAGIKTESINLATDLDSMEDCSM